MSTGEKSNTKKRTARQHKFITVKRFISLSETQQHAEKSKMVAISMASLSHMHTHAKTNTHTRAGLNEGWGKYTVRQLEETKKIRMHRKKCSETTVNITNQTTKCLCCFRGQRVGVLTLLRYLSTFKQRLQPTRLKMDNSVPISKWFKKKELPQTYKQWSSWQKKKKKNPHEWALKTTMQTCLASDTLQLS